MQWSQSLSPHLLPHDSLTVAGNALATASNAFQPAVQPKFDPTHTVTLYPGDCVDLLRTLPDHCVQLIVTSPTSHLGSDA